jgi:hypothetical protein
MERRSEPRFRCLLGAELNFGRRQRRMEGVLKNIASGGALLVFERASVTPREFELRIPSRRQTRQARVIWRGPDRIGVALSPLETPAPEDPAEKIRRLEAENRSLRQRLAPDTW